MIHTKHLHRNPKLCGQIHIGREHSSRVTKDLLAVQKAFVQSISSHGRVLEKKVQTTGSVVRETPHFEAATIQILHPMLSSPTFATRSKKDKEQEQTRRLPDSANLTLAR